MPWRGGVFPAAVPASTRSRERDWLPRTGNLGRMTPAGTGGGIHDGGHNVSRSAVAPQRPVAPQPRGLFRPLRLMLQASTRGANSPVPSQTHVPPTGSHCCGSSRFSTLTLGSRGRRLLHLHAHSMHVDRRAATLGPLLVASPRPQGHVFSCQELPQGNLDESQGQTHPVTRSRFGTPQNTHVGLNSSFLLPGGRVTPRPICRSEITYLGTGSRVGGTNGHSWGVPSGTERAARRLTPWLGERESAPPTLPQPSTSANARWSW